MERFEVVEYHPVALSSAVQHHLNAFERACLSLLTLCPRFLGLPHRCTPVQAFRKLPVIFPEEPRPKTIVAELGANK